jgi:thioredoxin 1
MAIFKKNIKKKNLKNSEKSYEEIVKNIVTLDNNNFTEFIDKYPFTIVDFWAPWCAPCKQLTPRFRRLLSIYKGKIAFGKLDTQKYPDIAKKYRILSIPHIILFNYGKKVSSLTGLKTVGEMKKEIDTYLKKIE